MVGTGLGAKRGVLFKNALALEAAALIEVVVMDKTGTLTKGEPEVTDVAVDGIDEVELLRLAAAVERRSEHRLADAIVHRADANRVPHAPVETFENVPGHGALATVDGSQSATSGSWSSSRSSSARCGSAAPTSPTAAAPRCSSRSTGAPPG